MNSQQNADKNPLQRPLLENLFVLLLFTILPLTGCSTAQKSVSPIKQIAVTAEDGDQGKLAWQKGDFAQAISHWEEALNADKNRDNIHRQCQLQDNLSQAYQSIGQLRSARTALETAQHLAEELNDPGLNATILNHFGSLYQSSGHFDLAEHSFQQGLDIAERDNNNEILAALYNNQGNLFLAMGRNQEAAKSYLKSIELSRSEQNSLLLATAQINYVAAIGGEGSHKLQANSILEQARETLRQVENFHPKACALIRLGLSYQDLPEKNQYQTDIPLQVFSEAAEIAEKIGDQRTLSYALGYAGKRHKKEQNLLTALELTRQAVLAAQQAGAAEALYRWQWQTARLLNELGERAAAIAAYRRTIYTLQSIRQEMDSCNGNSASQFRETASVVCFELIDLLLQRSEIEKDPEKQTSLLMETRDLIELLRVYELRNYFKDDCVDVAHSNTVKLDNLSKTAAVIYPILLKNRTELLVTLPTGLKRFTLTVDKQTLTQEVKKFRRLLEKRTTREFLPHAQRLYDDLIRPLEEDLHSAGVDTLVFVPGGILRTIPLAALHDGKQFLNNSYATVLTPGLNLIDPHPVNRQNIRIIVAGLTKPTQGFPALPYVEPELQAITSLYPSTVLLDEDFVTQKFKESLQQESFNVLHIASHGQFKNDVEQTFILSFDGKITMSTLGEDIGYLQFRPEPLDLLVLSACETAAGDELAALGLAGVAIKAGARSAVATLWHINDAATTILIEEFYRQIQNPMVSRATALQRAQLKLEHDPRYEHPAYWSPFLLINNWL